MMMTDDSGFCAKVYGYCWDPLMIYDSQMAQSQCAIISHIVRELQSVIAVCTLLMFTRLNNILQLFPQLH